MNEHCQDCKFWRNITEGTIGWGECHRNPPMVVPASKELHFHTHATVWPQTYQSDFCGEFKQKII